MSRRRVSLVASVVLLALVLLAGVSIATGSTEDDATEHPMTGSQLDRASRAALEHVGEGRVTGTEVDDEESDYEVEVTLGDGRQIDVQLDEDFTVVGQSSDDEGDE